MDLIHIFFSSDFPTQALLAGSGESSSHILHDKSLLLAQSSATDIELPTHILQAPPQTSLQIPFQNVISESLHPTLPETLPLQISDNLDTPRDFLLNTSHTTVSWCSNHS